MKADIPPSLFYVNPGPFKPSLEATQREAALIIIDLQENLEACKANLQAIREIEVKK